MMGFGFGPTFFTSAFPVLFAVVSVAVIGIFVVALVRGTGQWSKNNRSPVLTVDAQVVSKRTNVSHSGGGSHHTSTSYYATFQVESGDRLELQMSGPEYGLLAQGDAGRLTFQGTRYRGFERR